MEEAAAQEGVRQLLLVVGRDDDDGAVPGRDGLPCLVHEELHAIEFEQQVVGELDVGLVDLVDQQHLGVVGLERVPQLAADDVVGDVGHARVAQLAVAQAGHGIVLVKALLGAGGGLDVPFDQGRAEGSRDLVREDGLARAGLALDQEGALQGDGGVDGDLEVAGGDVAFGGVEAGHLVVPWVW